MHGHSHDGPHGHSHGGLMGMLESADTSVLAPCLCWKDLSPTARAFILRTILRLIMLGVLIALVRSFPEVARAAGSAVLNWLSSLGSPRSEIAFCAAATLFCALSPTGYLPAVAAGIAYAPQASIPVTYVAVSAGALINTVIVRGLCSRRLPCTLQKKYEARGASLLGSVGLARAISAHPVKIVALLRCPFLGNGALNYILSLHRTLRVRDMALGNAIGFIPGSVLFPVAGAQLKSLGALLAGGEMTDSRARDAAIGWFVGISFVVGLCILCITRVIKNVLAAEQKAADEAEAARAASPPSDATMSDRDIALIVAAFAGGSDKRDSAPQAKELSQLEVRVAGDGAQ